MNFSLLLRGVFVASAISFLGSPANAAFTLFEDFDSLNDGALNGQGPAGNLWTAQAGTTVLNTGGGDKVVNLATGTNIPNYRSLVPMSLSIPNSSAAATVYWNFTISSTTGNNWNFIVTDVDAPPDNAGSSEVQLNFDSGAVAALRARSAGAFLNLAVGGSLFAPMSNVLYNAWFQINNSADNYQVFLQSDEDSRVASRTLMSELTTGVSTFTFRNGASTNALTTINFGSGSTGSVVRHDDIYVDTAGFNAANPIPEPTSAVLLLGGVAGLCSLRRRR